MNKKREIEKYYTPEKKLLYKKRKQINKNFYFKTNKRFSRRKFSIIKYKKIKYFGFFVFIIFIIIIISKKIIHNTGKEPMKIFNIYKDKINYDFQENFPNLQDSFNNAKDFLDKCLNGSLINHDTIKNIEKIQF